QLLAHLCQLLRRIISGSRNQCFAFVAQTMIALVSQHTLQDAVWQGDRFGQMNPITQQAAQAVEVSGFASDKAWFELVLVDHPERRCRAATVRERRRDRSLTVAALSRSPLTGAFLILDIAAGRNNERQRFAGERLEP